MWMYAEIVDSSGTVLARAEGEVAEEGDLSAIASRAIARFRAEHSGRSFFADARTAGLTLRAGAADKPNT
jgi:hypothetical protein